MKGCNATRSIYRPNCWCDDSTPKRWYARLRLQFFTRQDMAARFIFDPDPDWDTRADRAPFEKNNTLFISELIGK